jgi:hypothetical protein
MPLRSRCLLLQLAGQAAVAHCAAALLMALQSIALPGCPEAAADEAGMSNRKFLSCCCCLMAQKQQQAGSEAAAQAPIDAECIGRLRWHTFGDVCLSMQRPAGHRNLLLPLLLTHLRPSPGEHSDIAETTQMIHKGVGNVAALATLLPAGLNGFLSPAVVVCALRYGLCLICVAVEV